MGATFSQISIPSQQDSAISGPPSFDAGGQHAAGAAGLDGVASLGRADGRTDPAQSLQLVGQLAGIDVAVVLPRGERVKSLASNDGKKEAEDDAELVGDPDRWLHRGWVA
ncbi:hypothetical protein ACIBCT_38975 [Streptosporangium sp. NPDC050855]|uniref:hypothetical protein n=1 Tax=Streptosporangium sp. NPDC050855 TaxID=3366194 RepID=UPI00379DFDF6